MADMPAARRRGRSSLLDSQLKSVSPDEMTATPGLALVDDAPPTQTAGEAAPTSASASASAAAAGRGRRAARAADKTEAYKGATHHLQAIVPLTLHNRYRRLAADLKRESVRLHQREWMAALLHEGPQSAAELRELLDATEPSVDDQYRHDQRTSTVTGLVPIELWARYDAWATDLFLDESYRTSVTRAVICLMHNGPQTTSQMRDLIDRWRLIMPR